MVHDEVKQAAGSGAQEGLNCSVLLLLAQRRANELESYLRQFCVYRMRPVGVCCGLYSLSVSQQEHSQTDLFDRSQTDHGQCRHFRGCARAVFASPEAWQGRSTGQPSPQRSCCSKHRVRFLLQCSMSAWASVAIKNIEA